MGNLTEASFNTSSDETFIEKDAFTVQVYIFVNLILVGVPPDLVNLKDDLENVTNILGDTSEEESELKFQKIFISEKK